MNTPRIPSNLLSSIEGEWKVSGALNTEGILTLRNGKYLFKEIRPFQEPEKKFFSFLCQKKGEYQIKFNKDLTENTSLENLKLNEILAYLDLISNCGNGSFFFTFDGKKINFEFNFSSIYSLKFEKLSN